MDKTISVQLKDPVYAFWDDYHITDDQLKTSSHISPTAAKIMFST